MEIRGRDASPAWTTACAVAAVAIFALAQGGARDLSHIDEHRYAEVSRVMAAGGDWLVPHVNGKVYSDKPPLFFWMAAAGQRAGIPLPTAAILPSQLGAFAAVLALFGIARRRLGLRAAVVAAAVLASGVRFASFAGRANLDALLTGFVTVAVYAYVRGEDAEGAPRAQRRWYTLACLSAGLGVLVKGPLAIAIPALVVVGSRLLEGRGRSLRTPWTAAALALALAPVTVWLCLAGARAGSHYVESILLRRALAQSLGQVYHRSPPWSYLRIFPSAFLPGTLLLPAALAAFPRRRPLARGDALATAWFAGGFLLVSAFPAKRHHYLMPIYPGAALAIGRLFADDVLAALRERPIARGLVTFGCWLFAAVGLVFALGLGASAVIALAGRAAPPGVAPVLASIWRSLAGAGPGTVAWCVTLALAAAAGASLAARRGAGARAAGVVAVALATALTQARIAEPLRDAAVDRRHFYDRVGSLVGDGMLAEYGGAQFEANWMLRRDVVPGVRSRANAERYFATHAPGSAFLLANRKALAREGLPTGTRVLLEMEPEGAGELVLIGPSG